MLHPLKMFSCESFNRMNCIQPIQPCLPLNVIPYWTRGLLHDSELNSVNDNMDDYFSTLFYDNTADVYGYDIWNELQNKRSTDDTDRICFYSKQNFIPSNGSERLYERNVEMDKLIAKFDANVQDIWRGSTESENQYQNLLSQNFIPNLYANYGSNLIWSFEQKENNARGTGLKPNEHCYQPSFSELNFQNCKGEFDTVLSAYNTTLSNIQKWSAMDTSNTSNFFSEQKGNDFSEPVFSKRTGKNSNLTSDVQYQISDNVQNNNEEEDDLLTSAKTHFRPIRAEELGSSQTGIYPDGTTFAISNDLEKVSFRRSESGLLYLEADANTPRKYMEFKEKEGGGNKADWDSDASSGEEFVPKFCLRQSNEKCIQTDEIDDKIITGNDTDCESISCKSEDEEDEFYFPGDEELAQNIINAIEDKSKKEESVERSDIINRNLNLLEMSFYQMAELKSCACGGEGDWNQISIGVPKEREWSQIWKCRATCDTCRSNSEKLSLNDRYLLREELTQEGEQLLLDLSSLHQMYSNSEWSDKDDEYDSTSNSDFNDEETHMSGEEIVGGPGKGAWWSMLIAKQEPVKNGFDLRCLWNEEKLFSEPHRNEKINRIVRDVDRKRRNSSSQKACNPYTEEQFWQHQTLFSHVGSVVGCFKGEPCTILHELRRPLSL